MSFFVFTFFVFMNQEPEFRVQALERGASQAI